ncbi:MAG: DUF3800 domain-containing protein [Chloroflexi bacterium]|nr:DUF3800 domain-containing protein [Chloroflexota bacterium]
MPSSRPSGFEERYRLYIDESGDHVYRQMAAPAHRFLCLLGCWFKNPDYIEFHESLEALKRRHFAHHPDDPVILHREDIINARREFRMLQDTATREAFDADLLETVHTARFTVVAVVIDKYELWRRLGEAAPHPYNIGLAFLLQRYVGYLNRISRIGDVMAESRGGTEDRRLADEFSRLYEEGTQYLPARSVQQALSSRSLKLKQKVANISGLQLSDLLGHPVKQWVLRRKGITAESPAPFSDRLMQAVEPKMNRHFSQGRVEGYGFVFYPK